MRCERERELGRLRADRLELRDDLRIEQLSAPSKRVSSVFTVAPNGVGQPRSACTIERSDVSTVPAACQP